jgi:hypothetical protein
MRLVIVIIFALLLFTTIVTSESILDKQWNQYHLIYKETFLPKNITKQARLWVDRTNGKYRLESGVPDVFEHTVLYTTDDVCSSVYGNLY